MSITLKQPPFDNEIDGVYRGLDGQNGWENYIILLGQAVLQRRSKTGDGISDTLYRIRKERRKVLWYLKQAF